MLQPEGHGFSPSEVIEIFSVHPSSHAMALGFAQPLTGMITKALWG
jgi:hypothetical protein